MGATKRRPDRTASHPKKPSSRAVGRPTFITIRETPCGWEKPRALSHTLLGCVKQSSVGRRGCQTFTDLLQSPPHITRHFPLQGANPCLPLTSHDASPASSPASAGSRAGAHAELPEHRLPRRHDPARVLPQRRRMAEAQLAAWSALVTT